MNISDAYKAQVRALADLGAGLHHRGWSLGTSSNYSIVVNREPLRLLQTASGKDKGRLGADDFVLIDGAGRVEEGAPNKPSAEMWLHLVLARHGAGAIIHTHSVWSTLLSDRYGTAGVPLEGYEMLKGLRGITTHEASKRVTVFENTQDIEALSTLVDAQLSASPPGLTHGFLLRRHGLYAWGKDLDEARRHLEIFEFLFEVEGRRLSMR
jgi:methylthioribulose-1-phosphate dehydratase